MSDYGLEDTGAAVEKIDSYVESENVSEKNLWVCMQLDFNAEDENYVLDYRVTAVEGSDQADDWVFEYVDGDEAWNNFLEQQDAINEIYPEANVQMPDPEEYRTGRGGGNPLSG